jgi:hypothetical protein
MKFTLIPATCTLALACMASAVASHWWSVGEFAAALSTPPRLLPPPPSPAATAIPAALPAAIAVVAAPTPPPASAPVPPATAAPVQVLAAAPPAPAQALPPSPAQVEFFETLLDEMKQLKRANTALRDQVAETNRDLMKLEFRVDTHSESFRPLPVAEEEPGVEPSLIDDGSGVLPPRPKFAGLPELE